jgi:histidinol-phosphate aminotransferase
VDERVITVIDQAYFEYIDREDYPDAVERYFKAGHDVVVLRTFSKIYGLAGQRVGYAIGPEQVVAAMTKVRRPFDLTTTAQVAATASIDGGAEIERRRAINAQGLERLAEILTEHGFEPVPSVGNFVYVDVGGDAVELFERLLHEGVIVRPLAGFGAPSAIRVSVGTPDEIDEFAGALGRALA